MTPLALTLKSLRNRRGTVALTTLTIALSVALLLGVERIRREVRTAFTNTISGTDLVVGARTSPVQLLLASVFRLGDATNNIEWESYESIAAHPAVAWTIPISLGDSHRGYRVLGTTGAYVEHLRHGRSQSLRMREGEWFDAEDGAVLGAEVASRLGYRVGDTFVVAHGAGDVSFVEHEEHPFTVTGVLAPTGTPVDRTVHVSLRGIDLLHRDMNRAPGDVEDDPLLAALEERRASHDHDHHDEPGEITAFFVGLTSRPAALGLQRAVNEFEGEPLTAVMPALALQQLWEIVGPVEKALRAVSGFVLVVGLLGMMVAILTGLNERRREMAILRSVGARPAQVFGLIVGEAVLVTATGVVSGFLLLQVLILLARPVVAARMGLHLASGLPMAYELALGAVIVLAGLAIGAVPAYRSYRFSLADGLTVKV